MADEIKSGRALANMIADVQHDERVAKEALVEKVARAMWKAWHDSVRRLTPPFPGDYQNDPDARERERWLAMARAAILALAEGKEG